MENPAITSQVKAFVIGSACLVLAIFLGYMIGTEEYASLLIGTVVVAACSFWFFSGPYFWVVAIASSLLGGAVPILGAQFTPFQMLMAMGLVKFAVEDVILRRIKIQTPDKFDALMIAGFMVIILAHGIDDRFGMRYLGSSVWGGRHYVNVFVGLAAYFVIQSIPVEAKVWAKFPYVVLAFLGFDLLIAIVTTILPNSVYYIYPFYSAVSSASLQEAIGGTEDVTARIGAFGNFGFMLLAIVMASVSLRTLVHPSNLFRILCLMVGSACALLSGFRSAVLNSFALLITTGIRDLKAGVFFLLPIIGAALFAVSLINSQVVALPKQIQRALAFLPGEWDTEMTSNAQASNQFRLNVWNLWYRQYFPEHPIVGRGFGFNREWTKQSIRYGEAADYQQMVETGNLHSGFLSSLDTFGILGATFFVCWNLTLLVRALRIPFDRRPKEYFALRFLSLYLAVWILCYWIGALTVGAYLPQQFALAGLFMRLRKDIRPTETPPRRSTSAGPREFQRRELARV